eukprot:TRINITY_DN2191_c0_g1_i1.p1 TRINITY_DN2191_c0_g1~~TRINITY_DN2191_c0_g1_i1.p1  ORF type:complete len:260 (+),score=43.02 TRINITY_DN2191_c0_g1_i1:43-822(+)
MRLASERLPPLPEGTRRALEAKLGERLNLARPTLPRGLVPLPPCAEKCVNETVVPLAPRMPSAPAKPSARPRSRRVSQKRAVASSLAQQLLSAVVYNTSPWNGALRNAPADNDARAVFESGGGRPPIWKFIEGLMVHEDDCEHWQGVAVLLDALADALGMPLTESNMHRAVLVCFLKTLPGNRRVDKYEDIAFAGAVTPADLRRVEDAFDVSGLNLDKLLSAPARDAARARLLEPLPLTQRLATTAAGVHYCTIASPLC